MFLLRCPKCRNSMKYSTKEIYLAGKKKRCVYCNHSFKIGNSIIGRLGKSKH